MLAGGRGRRLGGIDKGLQVHDGVALALHAARRLAPQVGAVGLNANRNLEAYAALGLPVWPDTLPDQPGPLAGFLAGLAHCATPYLATVPCDCPRFPLDLVARLARAFDADGAVEIAMAATPDRNGTRAEPVFCLLRAGLRDSIEAYLQNGQRKVESWAASRRCVRVTFDDDAAFFNVNTPADLQQLQTRA